MKISGLTRTISSKNKSYKLVGVIIATLFWGSAFNLLDERSDNSIYTWIFFVFICIMTGYVIGRTQVIKQLFERNEAKELLDEYNEMKNENYMKN